MGTAAGRSRRFGKGQSTLAVRPLVMEVPSFDKIGMALTSAVGANMALTVGARMIVAALTKFRTAWVLLAERASRVMKHSLREFLFLSKSLSENFLFLGGARGEASVAA